jgi:PAS domain-containing protein
MRQQELEVILMRQLASRLAMPVFLVDARGNLLYFNEAAEPILGRPFTEAGDLKRDELYANFKPSDQDGAPLKQEENPLYIARTRRQPAHLRYWIHGLDGVPRQIEGTAFPLVGQSDRDLGAVGIFWEIRD